jgi:hypothetical protein
VRSVEDELPGGCACTWGAVFWRGGCATEPACPDDSSGVEGVVPVSSSDPSSDLVNSSGESESCSATADPGGVSICSASTDAAAATTSGFGGGTFRGFMRTGVVADVCPMSKKPGGRGLSGWRHQISCIVATHQASGPLSVNKAWGGELETIAHTDKFLGVGSIRASQHRPFIAKFGQRRQIFICRRNTSAGRGIFGRFFRQRNWGRQMQGWAWSFTGMCRTGG